MSNSLYNDIVIPAARENAWATEELTKEDKYNESEAFANIVYLSAQMIIDSMTGPREYSDYVKEPISDDVAHKLHQKLKADFAWLLARKVIREVANRPSYLGRRKNTLGPGLRSLLKSVK